MTCPQCSIFEKQVDRLQLEIDALKEIHSHPAIAAGIKGEKLIVDIAKGKKTKRNAPHDIELNDGTRIEVKSSSCNTQKNSPNSRRWTWNGILKKDYDYIVLIGFKDGIIHKYNKDNSPHVYFLIKKEDISSLTLDENRRGTIHLNVNSKKSNNKCAGVWKYRKSPHEIKEIFEQLVVDKNK